LFPGGKNEARFGLPALAPIFGNMGAVKDVENESAALGDFFEHFVMNPGQSAFGNHVPVDRGLVGYDYRVKAVFGEQFQGRDALRQEIEF
jgi:hypothetical protein